jgi:hypothetical protein
MNRAARSKRKKGDGISPPYIVRDELFRLEYAGNTQGFPRVAARLSGDGKCSPVEPANDCRDAVIYHPVFLNG